MLVNNDCHIVLAAPKKSLTDYFYKNALICSQKIRSTFFNEADPLSVSWMIMQKIKEYFMSQKVFVH